MLFVCAETRTLKRSLDDMKTVSTSGKLRIRRRGYTRKDGIHVPPTVYFAKDRGKVGRTPESQKWFHPKRVLRGWSKRLSESKRHAVVRRSIANVGYLETWQRLHALGNIQKRINPEMARKAYADRDWMSKTYAKQLSLARKRVR